MRAPSLSPPPRSTCSTRSASGAASPPEAQAVSDIDITDSSLDAGIRPIVYDHDNHVKGGAPTAREPASFIVPASVLERALLQTVRANASITMLAPAEVTGVTPTDAGISVALKDREPVVASLLVGAEGRRSATRDAAGIDIIGWPYDQIAIVTTIAHAKPHSGHAVQHFLPGGPFALLPLPGDRSLRHLERERSRGPPHLGSRRGGLPRSRSTSASADAWATSSLRVHARELAARNTPCEELRRAALRPHRRRRAWRPSHRRSGLNLAFRDVAALTEVLAESRRLGLDLGDWDTLKRYERWRRFDSAVSATTFDALNRLFSNDNAVLRATRDFGLGLVDRTPHIEEAVYRRGIRHARHRATPAQRRGRLAASSPACAVQRWLNARRFGEGAFHDSTILPGRWPICRVGTKPIRSSRAHDRALAGWHSAKIRCSE